MLGLALVVLSVRHGKVEPIVAVVRLLGVAATSARTEAGGTSLGISLGILCPFLLNFKYYFLLANIASLSVPKQAKLSLATILANDKSPYYHVRFTSTPCTVSI